MADRKGLGLIGWMLGAVTASVIAIGVVVVMVSAPEVATASDSIALSANAR